MNNFTVVLVRSRVIQEISPYSLLTLQNIQDLYDLVMCGDFQLVIDIIDYRLKDSICKLYIGDSKKIIKIYLTLFRKYHFLFLNDTYFVGTIFKKTFEMKCPIYKLIWKLYHSGTTLEDLLTSFGHIHWLLYDEPFNNVIYSKNVFPNKWLLFIEQISLNR